MNKKGFTLIELVLVIVIVGMLAMYSLPRYMDLSKKHALVEMDGVVGAVRAGIAYKRAESKKALGGSGLYPKVLDEARNGPCERCFEGVLFQSVNDSRWRKVAPNAYQFDDGSRKFNYIYNQETGSFD